jgi:peptidoglycan/xylan/chitin deacetylase (PgdA/CDA1 family)
MATSNYRIILISHSSASTGWGRYISAGWGSSPKTYNFFCRCGILEKMATKIVGNTILNLLFQSGGFRVLQGANRRRLTVLNYHRIENMGDAAGAFFQPNISASTKVFEEQMEYLQKNYNVISQEQFLGWLYREEPLPEFPAMLTFDDGYRDNLTNALPILKKFGLPAIIFLTSGFIGTSNGFYWDIAAYCFSHTKKQSAFLPHLGEKVWADETAMRSVLSEWVEALKRISEEEKQSAMRALPAILEVEIPHLVFEKLMLSWEEARGMVLNGIAFGAHTVSHPILTRVPLEQAEHELVESKKQIEEKLGAPIHTLAYPNGQSNDISPEVINAAKRSGFQAAFSLMPGPSPFDEIRRGPFCIRRIYIGSADSLPRFAAKLAGVSRLLNKLIGL